MAQQKGFKRATKVAARKKKKKIQAKIANARRAIYQAEKADKEPAEKE